jgi:hypothetical protein
VLVRCFWKTFHVGVELAAENRSTGRLTSNELFIETTTRAHTIHPHPTLVHRRIEACEALQLCEEDSEVRHDESSAETPCGFAGNVHCNHSCSWSGMQRFRSGRGMTCNTWHGRIIRDVRCGLTKTERGRPNVEAEICRLAGSGSEAFPECRSDRNLDELGQALRHWLHGPRKRNASWAKAVVGICNKRCLGCGAVVCAHLPVVGEDRTTSKGCTRL